MKIVGWGNQSDADGKVVKYWLVANSWGPEWNGNGYFKIKRGENWCGIEEHVCFAQPAGHGANSGNQLAAKSKQTQLQLKQLSMDPSRVAGSWVRQQNAFSALSAKAAHHHITNDIGMHNHRRGMSLSSDPNQYKIERVHTQVVAGYHVHLAMSTKDASGKPYMVHALMQVDHTGTLSTVAAHAHSVAPVFFASSEENAVHIIQCMGPRGP